MLYIKRYSLGQKSQTERPECPKSKSAMFGFRHCSVFERLVFEHSVFGRCDCISDFRHYSRAPKSEQFGFRTENNGLVVKPFRFWMTSENRTLFSFRMFGLSTSQHSQTKLDHFIQKVISKTV